MDYAPSPTDDSILQMPLKQELMPEDMTNVFGYPRDLRRRCALTSGPDMCPTSHGSILCCLSVAIRLKRDPVAASMQGLK